VSFFGFGVWGSAILRKSRRVFLGLCLQFKGSFWSCRQSVYNWLFGGYKIYDKSAGCGVNMARVKMAGG